MGNTLEKLKVIIEGTAAPYKKVVEETKKMTREMVQSVASDTEKMNNGRQGKGIVNAMKDAQRAVKLYAADARVAAGISVYNPDFVLLAADIKTLEATAESLQMQMRNLEITGHVDTDEYWDLQGALQDAEEEAVNLRDRLREMVDSGAVTRFAGLVSVARRVGRAFLTAGREIGQTFANGLRRAAGAAQALIHRFRNAISAVRNLHKAARGSGISLKQMGTMLMIAGLGVQSITSIFGKLRSAIKDGFSTLAEISAPAAATINSLKTSLGQMKISLATAFLPILETVAPLLNFLIEKITAVINAFGSLMAALTGRGTFTRATSAAGAYAAGLNNAAGSASKANEENKKLQRTLMGFDEINKLNEKDETPDASGNAGGGGGGAGGGLLEEVPISSQIKDFVKKIKDAWKQADFTEIGRIVGEKLRDALEKIPWDKIKDTCNKIAKSVATFLNGYFETPGLFTAVGSTIGNGLNTAFESINTFATTFHWGSLGKSISDSINGFIRTFDWKGAATSVSNVAKGILDALITAIENTNWQALGESVKEFIVNIDWNGIADRIFEAIGAAIGGLAAFLWGLVGDAWASVVEWWHDTAFEDGQFTIQGLLDGIVEKLKGIWDWIKEHIFQPFIDGFKKAFGIESPSTVMKEQGGLVIQGFLDGLGNTVGRVIEWAKGLPGRILTALGEAKDWLLEKGKDAIQGLIDGFGVRVVTALLWMKGLPGRILTALGEAKEWLVQKGKDAITGIRDGWEAVKDSEFLDKVRAFKDEVFEGLGDIWETVKSKGSDIIGGIKEGFNNDISGFLELVAGIPGSILDSLGDMFELGKGVINSFIEGLKSISIPIPDISVSWTHYGLGPLSINIPDFSLGYRYVQPLAWLPTFASGGFPDMGEMFIARENGPEMVGRMGNRNAVANNEQITDGIAKAVGPAVYDAVRNAMNESGERNGGGDVYIMAPDGNKLFSVIREEGMKYQQSTGMPVFEG